MPEEKAPANPVPRKPPQPPDSRVHKIVGDGAIWAGIARRYGTTAQEIQYLNFRTTDAAEVNWYVRNYMGCTCKVSGDGVYWDLDWRTHMVPSPAPTNHYPIYVPLKRITTPSAPPVAGGPRSQDDVARLTLKGKLIKVIEKTIERLPSAVGEQLRVLIEPQNLAIMAAVVAVWAVSHFFGIGEIIDVILLVAGAAALGMTAFSAGKELVGFATKTYSATSDADLDGAAGHLAQAISLIGVETVMALLLKQRPRAFQHQHLGGPVTLPPSMPGPGSRIVYRPRTTLDPTLPAGHGATTVWGDIRISSRGSAADRALALAHEKVHQFLTPKLYPLRNVRVRVGMESYNRSYILRYLEEALAETFAQLRVNGINPTSVLTGGRFPVRNGYVTWGAMAAEAGAALLGPVNVAGMNLMAWYSMEDSK